MNWHDMLAMTQDAPVFTASLLLTGRQKPESIRRQLDRWVASGKLVMLRRGVYRIAYPYVRRPPHPFVVANFMRKSSYVSLQSALAYYGMIPEYTPVTTSVTTARPEAIDTPDGRFAFRHVKGNLFFGYGEREVSPGFKAVIATPEKALLDLLYLTPGSDSPAYLETLRAEPAMPFNGSRFAAMAERIGSAKVDRAVKRLLALWADEKKGETTL